MSDGDYRRRDDPVTPVDHAEAMRGRIAAPAWA